MSFRAKKKFLALFVYIDSLVESMTVLFVTKECPKCHGFGTEDSMRCFCCEGKGTILTDITEGENDSTVIETC